MPETVVERLVWLRLCRAGLHLLFRMEQQENNDLFKKNG